MKTTHYYSIWFHFKPWAKTGHLGLHLKGTWPIWCRASHPFLRCYLTTSRHHKGTVRLFTQLDSQSHEKKVVITPVQCVNLTYLRVNCAVRTGVTLRLQAFKDSFCLNAFVLVVKELKKPLFNFTRMKDSSAATKLKLDTWTLSFSIIRQGWRTKPDLREVIEHSIGGEWMLLSSIYDSEWIKYFLVKH